MRPPAYCLSDDAHNGISIMYLFAQWSCCSLATQLQRSDLFAAGRHVVQ